MSDLPPAFLDLVVSGQTEQFVPDNTVGIFATYDDEKLPDSLLVDPERLERAMIAYREEFEQPSQMNMAVIRDSEGKYPLLALYPEDGENRARAVVVAPRTRQSEADGNIEVKEVEP